MSQVVDTMTEEEFWEATNCHDGICYACGEYTGPVEPDAEGYECPACGEMAVSGVESAMVEGRIDII